MLKIRVVVNGSERKEFLVDSPTFEQAQKRILRLYPNAKFFELIGGLEKKNDKEKEKV